MWSTVVFLKASNRFSTFGTKCSANIWFVYTLRIPSCFAIITEKYPDRDGVCTWIQSGRIFFMSFRIRKGLGSVKILKSLSPINGKSGKRKISMDGSGSTPAFRPLRALVKQYISYSQFLASPFARRALATSVPHMVYVKVRSETKRIFFFFSPEITRTVLILKTSS